MRNMPRIVDHDQRRREIAFGVLQVMAERGLAAVTLRSVAAAAGVSMGRIQHYFATKDDLLHHACRTVVDLAAEGYQNLSTRDPRERLRHLTQQGIPRDDIGRLGAATWYTFVTASVTDETIAEIIRDAWRGLRSTMDELVAELAPNTSAYVRQRHVDVLTATMDGVVLRVVAGALTPELGHAALDAVIDAID